MRKWRRTATTRRYNKTPSRLREKPKDHEALPDTLDTGYRENRGFDGSLYIHLKDQPNAYIVVGKYLSPQKEGAVYYVSDYTDHPLAPTHVYKFDHLLLAIAQVHEIISEFERTGE